MREAAVLHADEKDLLGLSGEGGEEERRMRVVELLIAVWESSLRCSARRGSKRSDAGVGTNRRKERRLRDED